MTFKKRVISFVLSTLISLSTIAWTSGTAKAQVNSQIPAPTTQLSEKLHGFYKTSTLNINDRDIHCYRHEKSGGYIVVDLTQGSENTFDINFRTPAENNKGANHIIEHCALNGSKRYPFKNLIWELSGIAFAKMINAFTMDNYTSYVLQSYDAKELESMAKIYVDGVFNPNFLTDEKIFKKEGIRYELNDGQLVANGTVFNEVSNPLFKLAEPIHRRLFPHTQNAYFAGGVPEDVMDLTYEEVCQTYRKYYHPANCMIHLSGNNLDYGSFFKWIDEEYFSKYSCEDAPKVTYLSQDCIKLEKFKREQTYNSTSEKDLYTAIATYYINDQTYAQNKILIESICSIFNNPDSAQNKFMKSKGYSNFSALAIDAFYNPVIVFEIITDDFKLTEQNKLQADIDDLLEKHPITDNDVQKTIKNKNFDENLKKSILLQESPISTDSLMYSFIHFGYPLSEKAFNKKTIYTTSEANNFIKTNLTDSARTFTVFEPSHDENLNMKNKVDKKLKKLESKREYLTIGFEEQKAWSESPNNTQDVQKLKAMFKNIADIQTQKYNCDVQEKYFKGTPIYTCNANIGDFAHITSAFKINDLTIEDKFYLNYLISALNTFDTCKSSREKFENKKSDKIKISLSPTLISDKQNEKNAYLMLNILVTKQYIHDLPKLLQEQLSCLMIEDIPHLENFAKNSKINYDVTPKTLLALNEHIAKYDYLFMFLNSSITLKNQYDIATEILENIHNEEYTDNIFNKIHTLKNKIFSINRLQGIGVCSNQSKDILKICIKSIYQILCSTPASPDAKLNLSKPVYENIAFLSQEDSNNTIIAQMHSEDLPKDVNFYVLKDIIINKYLAPKIRENGGAYTANLLCSPDNDEIIIISSSDPNLSKTIEIFKNIDSFVESYNFTQEEIENVAKSLITRYIQTNKLKIFTEEIKSKLLNGEGYCEKTNQKIADLKQINVDSVKSVAKKFKELLKNMKICAKCGNIKSSDKLIFDKIM